MKLISIRILLATLVLSIVSQSYALTPTPTPSPAPTEKNSNLDEKVKVLKEKLENKVAEISKTNQQVVVGIIDVLKEGSMSVKGPDDKVYSVTLDKDFSDIKQISPKGEPVKVKSTDLEKGDYIVVQGFNLEDDVNANKIYIQSSYQMIEAQITSVNESNSLDIVTSDKTELTLDIEKTTVQQMLNSKTLAIERSGFSKYKIGDHITAAIKLTDAKKASAVRILLVPQEYFGQ